MFRKIKDKIYYWFFVMMVRSMPELEHLIGAKNFFLLKDSISRVTLGKNTKIYSPANVHESTIGNYTYVAQNSVISMATIGKCCSIGPNFVCGWGIHPTETISSHPMFFSTRKQNGMTLSAIDKIDERKPITIGNDVFIGANVTILDGVTIGDGAVIGAGAVVSKDIPSYAVAVGCPIRILRYRFDEDTRQKLLQIKWWDFDEERLPVVEKMIFDVEGFIKKYSKNETLNNNNKLQQQGGTGEDHCVCNVPDLA